MTQHDPYTYPGSSVLQNLLDIRDAVQLDGVERELAVQRVREGVPGGDFDLAHLRAIHRNLFQDLYESAGQVRTVEIAKGGSQFQFRQFIETGMADIHGRLRKRDFLRGLSADVFAVAAGEIIGDVNYVHPFREGNGRTQALYLEQLAARAGHPIDLRRIDRARWMAASRASHTAEYDLLAAEIRRAIM